MRDIFSRCPACDVDVSKRPEETYTSYEARKERAVTIAAYLKVMKERFPIPRG
jgi:hypothetical protein